MLLLFVLFLSFPLSTQKGLSTVSNIKASKVTASSIELIWNKIENVSSYYVFYKANYQSSYHVTNTSTNRIKIKELEHGTTYRFQVQLSETFDEVSPFVIIYTKTLAFKRETPFIETIATGKYYAKITWNKMYGIRKYHVAYKAKSRDAYKIIQTTESKAKLEDLKAYTTYVVKVQTAYSDFGPGPWSKPVNFRTKPAPPSAPMNPKICGTSRPNKDRVNLLLCWSPPIEVDEEYEDLLKYSITWCISNLNRPKRHGCFREYEIEHVLSDQSQTAVLRNVLLRSLVLFKVTSFASNGLIGGSANGTYSMGDIASHSTIPGLVQDATHTPGIQKMPTTAETTAKKRTATTTTDAGIVTQPLRSASVLHLIQQYSICVLLILSSLL